MNNYLNVIVLILSLLGSSFRTHGQVNYLNYHKEIEKCEQLIVESKFEEAVNNLDSLFNQFHFIFLRDIKLATQLSAIEKDLKSGFRFIKLGILNGWTLENITKNDKLRLFHENPEWENIRYQYDSLHEKYLSKLNTDVKNQVHEMFKNDQKKALGALFRIGQKSKNKYAEKRFAPQSEKHMKQLDQILNKQGYPGEQLIGNNLWGSVILSHHNSISVNYNSKDTLFTHLRPKLMDALKKGEISPYELAVIEDWKIAALNAHELTSYGFLGAIPSHTVLDRVNENRTNIGLRSIELRNDLIDFEQATGFNLNLPKSWHKGKITVANN